MTTSEQDIHLPERWAVLEQALYEIHADDAAKSASEDEASGHSAVVEQKPHGGAL